MNVNLGIWGKLTRVVIFLLVIAGLALVAIWYLPLIKTNERMRKEILRLDAEILAEKEIQRQHSAALDAIRHDPKTVERLAREKLGYAKPGETVVRFQDPPTNNPARPR